MKAEKKATIRNAGWLMGGKIMHMVLSFLISILTARYLGPGNYGLINYAAAYVTFFTAFCTLGINSVIVKNFIDHPDEEGETIGTTLILRLISSIFSICAILGIVSIVDANQPVTLTVVALYCISLVFQIFDTFNYWFLSKLRSKYYAIATMISYAVATAYRCILLVNDKSVEWFAVVNSIDYCIVAILLYTFYKRECGPKLSFSWRKTGELLSVSRSYILSSLMVAVYGATDKLMLKHMLDENAVGFYSLAVSISTMWVFVLSSIIDSLKPTIMRYHNEDTFLYEKTNRALYAIVFYVSLAASVCISIIAPWFIEIAYGKEYLRSVETLRLVIWYVAFAYLGVARNIWVVCERKQKYLKYLYGASAVMNVVLNYLMIPRWGIEGAAFATVATQMSTIFIFPLFIREFRPNVKLLVEAVKLKGLMRSKKQITGDRSDAYIIITAGSNYQDIDAYACCVALAELMRLKGERAVAYSQAPCNYSVCKSLIAEGQMANQLPADCDPQTSVYIIADVSDPDYVKDSVPLDRVTAVYDHHVGFEAYWAKRIGEDAKIEFLGAAATLVCREWKAAELYEKMSRSTALLLIAAILDNTLNLTSSNTTTEDVQTFRELCEKEKIGRDWCDAYFAEVQASVEADLKNAIFNDLKTLRNNAVLPPRIAQLCVWNADNILARLNEIREWFSDGKAACMINIIDIQHYCSWFICDDVNCQNEIERVFEVRFEDGVARSKVAYLRKELLKKTYSCK